MALIKCPDCGADVSDAAPVCPKCGRPIARQADEPDAPSAAPRSKAAARSSTRVTVTVSSFVLVCAGIFAAIWFVPALEIGEAMQARCQVNGTGDGSCQFTNTGWTPGSLCVVVNLVNKEGGADVSGPVCSGRVWPNDTADRHVSILLDSKCEALGGLLPVLSSDKCSMVIHNVGEDDIGSGSPSSAAAPASTSDSSPAPAASSSTTDNGSIPSTPSSDADAVTADAAAASAAADAAQAAQDASAAAQSATETPSSTAEPPSADSSPASSLEASTAASASPVLQALIAKTSGPSFDCSTATNVTAVAICGNVQLSQLDRQMAILYYSQSNFATDPAVRDQQRAWIRDRNSSCLADVACLRHKLNDRIGQLQQAGSPASN